jgi:hypothetical protein
MDRERFSIRAGNSLFSLCGLEPGSHVLSAYTIFTDPRGSLALRHISDALRIHVSSILNDKSVVPEETKRLNNTLVAIFNTVHVLVGSCHIRELVWCLCGSSQFKDFIDSGEKKELDAAKRIIGLAYTLLMVAFKHGLGLDLSVTTNKALEEELNVYIRDLRHNITKRFNEGDSDVKKRWVTVFATSYNKDVFLAVLKEIRHMARFYGLVSLCGLCDGSVMLLSFDDDLYVRDLRSEMEARLMGHGGIAPELYMVSIPKTSKATIAQVVAVPFHTTTSNVNIDYQLVFTLDYDTYNLYILEKGAVRPSM